MVRHDPVPVDELELGDRNCGSVWMLGLMPMARSLASVTPF